MKKSELKEICENEGFAVSFGTKTTTVRIADKHYNVATISEERIYSLSIDFSSVDYSKDHSTIFHACFDYASTLLEDRTDEVKYKLYHRYMNTPKDSQYYKVSLTLDENDCLSVVKNEEFLPSCQVIKKEFTKEEIEQIKEMYSTTLDDFEIYEVGEEDELD